MNSDMAYLVGHAVGRGIEEQIKDISQAAADRDHHGIEDDRFGFTGEESEITNVSLTRASCAGIIEIGESLRFCLYASWCNCMAVSCRACDLDAEISIFDTIFSNGRMPFARINEVD
jgi:hypothetical protein